MTDTMKIIDKTLDNMRRALPEKHAVAIAVMDMRTDDPAVTVGSYAGSNMMALGVLMAAIADLYRSMPESERWEALRALRNLRFDA